MLLTEAREGISERVNERVRVLITGTVVAVGNGGDCGPWYQLQPVALRPEI